MTVNCVLDNRYGLIEAPAGCGKTHLITDTLQIAQPKPYLVLTHTTAGVTALKQRLKRAGVSGSNFVISTVDGWALKVANSFPTSCPIGISPDNARDFYPALRRTIYAFIADGHISDIIYSSYARVLVDEYQDCDVNQHSLICALADILPVTVFGDPLQSIFRFGGPMPCWHNDVKSRFPLLLSLNTPWRWVNAGCEQLGQWILHCRQLLLNGHNVDFTSCPGFVIWHQLVSDAQTNSNNYRNVQFEIRRNIPSTESLLVIGDSRNRQSRHNFASSNQGIDVVEPVDLMDVLQVASLIDNAPTGAHVAEHIISTVAKMVSGVEQAKLRKRLNSILAGKNRTPPTDIEHATAAIVENASIKAIDNFLKTLECSPTTKVYRKQAYSAFKDTINHSINNPEKSVKQSAEVIREQRRHFGDRRIPHLAIGSTLLLKGLESAHALILNAGQLDAANLYVALSRGAKSINVFSMSSTVNPSSN